MPPSAEPEPNKNQTGDTTAAPEASSEEVTEKAPELTPEQNEFNNKKKFKSLLIDKLKNAVILEASSPEHARIGQKAGVKAILTTEAGAGGGGGGGGAFFGRIPGGGGGGGSSRMIDPVIVTQFIDAVALPIIARIRQGHTAEAYVMEATGVDGIEESGYFGTIDDKALVDKTKFTTPFMCTADDLVSAIARISEGAQIIRLSGKYGKDADVSTLATTIYTLRREIRGLKKKTKEELDEWVEKGKVPMKNVKEVMELGKLPVPMYASGSISTPDDVAFFMNFGCDGIVVSKSILKAMDPERRLSALVQAVKCYKDKDAIAQLMDDFERPA